MYLQRSLQWSFYVIVSLKVATTNGLLFITPLWCIYKYIVFMYICIDLIIIHVYTLKSQDRLLALLITLYINQLFT